jgi:hypothetical protein
MLGTHEVFLIKYNMLVLHLSTCDQEGPHASLDRMSRLCPYQSKCGCVDLVLSPSGDAQA